jgi:hypothetical protein
VRACVHRCHCYCHRCWRDCWCGFVKKNGEFADANSQTHNSPDHPMEHTQQVPQLDQTNGLCWWILFSYKVPDSVQFQLSRELQTELSVVSHWNSGGDCIYFSPRNATKVLCVIYDIMDVSCSDIKILKFERPKLKNRIKRPK